MKILRIEVDSPKKERLDRYVAKKTDLTRSQVKKLAQLNRIGLNNNPAKAGDIVVCNDLIIIDLPPVSKIELEPETRDLDLIYEDNDLIVLNKEQGMVMYPAKGHQKGTLAHILLGYGSPLSNIGGEARPGIVHRLDKETSGIVLIAKNNLVHKRLSLAFKNRRIHREYVALTKGNWKTPLGSIEAPIGRDPVRRTRMAVVPGGRQALTRFKILYEFEEASFVKLDLITGRTHQLRVHLSYAGHPILGDMIYNPEFKNREGSLMLHAAKIAFEHPITGEKVAFAAPLPLKFGENLRMLFQGKAH